jgi:two-component system sensor histidine kinase KdpD
VRVTRTTRPADHWRFAAALAAVALTTIALRWGLGVTNAGIVATAYLTVVLVVAATSRLRVAVVTSVVAMACMNFFFLPPVGTFTVADPQNWAALFAFLAVSLVASNLSAVARARTDDAVERRLELARLFDLSRDVLLTTDSGDAIVALARSIARRFDLAFVAIAVPRGSDWSVFESGTRSIPLDRRQLANAFAVAQTSLEFDAYARTYAGHRTVEVEGDTVRLVPLRVGTTPIGVLAAAGREVEAGTLDTLAGIVAIAIERAEFLEERKAGELTRQRERLQTAVLASVAHDLRTPLTAIRLAATNLKDPQMTGADRVEQSELVLAEVERLSRLFQNLLDMARIDAGAVATAPRRTHPSEIVAAARDQVEHLLHGHPLDVHIEPDVAVTLDPQLTAAALAHVLENAAQYSPAGSTIHVGARVEDRELRIEVRDEGPGIAAADLPRLFERFYRGAGAKTRAAGTGMGLWIVRGLLAVAGGRVWADNPDGGGARFTIAVPFSAMEAAARA